MLAFYRAKCVNRTVEEEVRAVYKTMLTVLS